MREVRPCRSERMAVGRGFGRTAALAVRIGVASAVWQRWMRRRGGERITLEKEERREGGRERYRWIEMGRSRL
jgi:hypothetical protein